MVSGSVSRRYAKALFAIGEEKGNLLGLQKEVERAAEVWSGALDLRNTLSNPQISLAARKSVWEAVVRRLGVSPLGLNFLLLLFDKGRLVDLPGIARELGVLSDRKENRLRAEVTGAAPVPDAVVMRLKTALQRHTGKIVVMSKREDPQLIGGVVTRVGDLMYDGSVRTRLERMKEAMMGGG